MSPELSLLLVALALALSECARWLPISSIALIGATRAARIRHPARLIGNRRGGFVGLDPLTAPGAAFAVFDSPVAFGPDALCAPGPRGATSARQTAWRYDDITTVRAVGSDLRLNGTRLVRCPSEAIARRLAALIESLRPARPAERARLIEASLAARFDLDAVRAALAALARHRRAPRRTAALLAIGLFIAAPLLSDHFGLAPIAAPLGLGLLALHVMHLIVQFRARRALDPADRADRWLDAVKVLLCPPMAVRSPDALSWHRLDAFDPIAAAAVIASPDAFRRHAIDTRRALRHPLRAIGLDAAAQAVVDADRRRRLTQIEAFITAHGVEEEPPPPASDPSLVAWCPRCLTGYRHRDGECSDCPGVPLIAR